MDFVKRYYTTCSGEGTLPWCKLSDRTDNVAECLAMIFSKLMTATQYCCRECVPTCRYLQRKGYTCFNGLHDLEINVDGVIKG